MKLSMYEEEYYKKHFPDPQEAEVFCVCDATGDDIYEGELFYETCEGEHIIYDIDVLLEHLGVTTKTAGDGE